MSRNSLREAGDRDFDSAEAAAEVGETRLAGERKVAAALRALEAATDLSSYLAALADASANNAGGKTDLGNRASFVFTHAPTLQSLPRPILAPRVAAMWDAAATADPQGSSIPPCSRTPNRGSCADCRTLPSRTACGARP